MQTMLFKFKMASLRDKASFSLNGEHLSTAQKLELMTRIKDNTKLTFLNLVDFDIDPQTAELFAAALQDFTLLRELYLSRCKVRTIDLMSVVVVFVSCESLKILDISNCNLGDSGASLIAAAIANCSALQTVALRSNNIGDIGAEFLSRVPSNNKTIEGIDLAGNRITDAVIPHLVAVILATPMQTESRFTLTIENNPFTNLGLKSLLAAMFQHKITCLNFNDGADRQLQAAFFDLLKLNKELLPSIQQLFVLISAGYLKPLQGHSNSAARDFVNRDGDHAISGMVLDFLTGPEIRTRYSQLQTRSPWLRDKYTWTS